MSCGAVLVESGKDGRRRRILRPWGLLRQAPLTVSPSMGEVEEARAAHLSARARPAWPGPLAIGATAAMIVAAALMLQVRPKPVAGEATAFASVTHSSPLQAAEPVRALKSTRLAVEVPVVAPPLIEPIPAAAKPHLAASRHAGDPAPGRSPEPRDATRRSAPRPVAAQPAAVVVAELPAPDPVVERAQVALAAPPAVVAAAPAVVTERPDRWAPLRNALAACEGEDGIFTRATCAERARLDNCINFWGHHPLCPVRGSSGQ